MGDLREPLGIGDRERMLAESATGDNAGSEAALAAADEATLADLKAELDTIAAELREPPPVDEFGEESDCRRAVELVESIGRSADVSSSDAVGAAPAADDRIALERLGPYEVTAKLGEGGMGAVYKAIHPKLKRTVAIKVLPARRMRDAAAIARFEREMETVGGLNHPNIVAAHDAGEDAGMHYLVMEYVDGVDLAALVRRVGPLAPADACEIVRQAACGLAEASARGIVHRDVKPSNLMLAGAAGDGAASLVKILDFGLARLSPLHADDGALTTSGLIMGTLKYMAPEQCSQSHAVDVRADVYSLGATLYKLLCGSSPFSDERFNSPLALLAALGGEEPPPLASRRSDVPAPLAAVVHRMLAKNPAERFASPGEVVEALTPWAIGANLSELLQRARSADERAPDSQSLPIPRRFATRTPLSEQRGVRHGLPLGRALLAGLVVGALAGGYFLFGGQGVSKDAAAGRDRGAAEWLALHNARMGVILSDGEYREITAGSPLPDGPLELNIVDLNSDKLLRDEDLGRFQGLPKLQVLNLSYTNAGDAGLARLNDLPQLEHLFLVETRVTDASLAKLRQFDRIATLHLARTAISDAGLEFLAALPALNELSLVDCRVSDAGLPALAALSTLRSLHLQETEVTAGGVADLQLALPGCSVLSDFTDEEVRHAASYGVDFNAE